MLGFVMGLLAGHMGRSSETFQKAYYRYGFYLGLPFSLLFMIVMSRDEVSSLACSTLIVIYVLLDLNVTYLAWRRCSGKGF